MKEMILNKFTTKQSTTMLLIQIFFITLILMTLLEHPESNYHADSIIGITLIDTFGDYFNEYWDKDYTLSKIQKRFHKIKY